MNAPRSRPRVVIAEPLAPEPLAWLRERADVIEPEQPGGLAAALGEADALIVRTYTHVGAAMLEGAPRLRVVGRAGVGLDNIDTAACAARGIRIVNTPDANTDAVVEYVIAAVMAHLRPIPAMPEDPAGWSRAREAAIVPRELSELTVGIWGLGRIGSAVARALAPLAGRVVYHDLRVIPPAERRGAEPVGQDELLSRSDVLTLHVDGRPENRHLVGAEALTRVKPGVLLVNASRGMVVDAGALAAHLHRDPSAWAVIDVHAPEPVTPEYPLLTCPNAVLTPHTAAATRRAKSAMSWVVRGVWEALQEPASPGG